MKPHVDDFTLLRLVAGELAGPARQKAEAHLFGCRTCGVALSEVRSIDRGLRELAASGGFEAEEIPEPGFSTTDPFRRRPPAQGPSRGELDVGLDALKAAETARIATAKAFETAGGVPLRPARGALRTTEDRLTLLYELQEAGRGIAEDPVRALGFAQATIRELLKVKTGPGAVANVAERVASRDILLGHAHILAAQALIWTKEFARSGSHLRVAYRSFGRAGDETGLALVELNESQRRSFIGQGRTALPLASRARATFEERTLDELAARAMVAEGIAHFDLGNFEKAVAACRESLPIFERYGLWSNYVGALNSIATALTRLGRLDEARREYARVLRRFSKKEHRSWQGFVRIGLAEILFSAGRFHEAAQSAAVAGEVFAGCGLRANALIVWLLEVEAWARHGDIARARRRLEGFWKAARDEKSIDQAVKRQLEAALTGADTGFKELSRLRAHLDEKLLRSRATS
jgi:tetratricopeptide (TPR) repeat protein